MYAMYDYIYNPSNRMVHIMYVHVWLHYFFCLDLRSSPHLFVRSLISLSNEQSGYLRLQYSVR